MKGAPWARQLRSTFIYTVQAERMIFKVEWWHVGQKKVSFMTIRIMCTFGVRSYLTCTYEKQQCENQEGEGTSSVQEKYLWMCSGFNNIPEPQQAVQWMCQFMPWSVLCVKKNTAFHGKRVLRQSQSSYGQTLRNKWLLEMSF